MPVVVTELKKTKAKYFEGLMVLFALALVLLFSTKVKKKAKVKKEIPKNIQQTMTKPKKPQNILKTAYKKEPPKTLTKIEKQQTTANKGLPPLTPQQTKKINKYIQRSPLRENIFHYLTSNIWKARRGLETMIFYRNGSCYWASYPGGFCGTPNFIRTIKWNFKEKGKYHGLLLFEKSTNLFKLKMEDHVPWLLRFRHRNFKPFSKKKVKLSKKDSPKFHSRTLPQITAIPSFSKLISASWIKTNDFDIQRRPKKIQFFTDGTLQTWYQNCSHRGSWSVATSRQPFFQLFALEDKYLCKKRNLCRNTHIASYNAKPILRDGLLIFSDNVYCSEKKLLKSKKFIIKRFAQVSRLHVEGDYVGNFTQNMTTKIRFTLKNQTYNTIELKNIKITLDPWKQKITLANVSYKDFLIATQKPHIINITIQPTIAAKQIYMEFEINYVYKKKYQYSNAFNNIKDKLSRYHAVEIRPAKAK